MQTFSDHKHASKWEITTIQEDDKVEERVVEICIGWLEKQECLCFFIYHKLAFASFLIYMAPRVTKFVNLRLPELEESLTSVILSVCLS